MKEIIFRGKQRNGNWTQGYLARENAIYDGSATHKVDKDTVGMFTGFTDVNGQKIFERDILEDTVTSIRYLAKWFDEFAGFYIANEGGKAEEGLNTDFLLPYLKIVGNIHDDPEELCTKWF